MKESKQVSDPENVRHLGCMLVLLTYFTPGMYQVREDGECTVDRCTLRIDLRIRDTDVTIQHKDGHHVTVNDKRYIISFVLT